MSITEIQNYVYFSSLEELVNAYHAFYFHPATATNKVAARARVYTALSDHNQARKLNSLPVLSAQKIVGYENCIYVSFQ
jgi:hypothetical protein